MEKIIVKTIVKKANRIDIDFAISEGLKQYFLPEHHFFAEYSQSIEGVPDSIAVIPLLVNLLPFSWITDSFVWADRVDLDFYHAVPDIMRGLSQIHKDDFNLRGGFIAARPEANRYEPEERTILLYTGGGDSMATYYRIEEKKPVLLNANGWYETDIREDEVYDADRALLSAFADRNGLEYCMVRSNFARFIRGDVLDRLIREKYHSTWWYGFQHSLAFLGCAAVFGYKRRCSYTYISSSDWTDHFTRCVSDPRVDPMFRCASMQVVHDGYELSKRDKIAYLVQKQHKLQEDMPLQVCSFHAGNCCKCEKCFRTMLQIHMLGGDVRKFNFPIEGSLKENTEAFLEENVLEVLDPTHFDHWRSIWESYEAEDPDLPDRELYQFLKTYPWEQKKKEYLRRYYSRNFMKILRRKLHLK